MCHGEVIPKTPSEQTVIELVHRLSSGLCLPIAIALIVWIRKRYPAGHRVRVGVYVSTLFLLLEAALGALLVKFKLVADNDSVARAVVIALHLVNTFALVGFGALTAWWIGGGGRIRWRGDGRWAWLAAMAGMVAVSMAGAVTALGDTLFPVDAQGMDGLLERIWGDLSPAEHFLVRLRILHPVMAVVLGLGLLLWTSALRWKPLSKPAQVWAGRVALMVFAEMGLGVLNVYLSAPGWMQLAHLAAANLLWIALCLLGGALLEDPATA
jgi:heme A synthase